ncbi:unnamed protein product [Nezara viridula]|uniref:Uncharacterized protein n=1 Tax=Nezara viridula TaxID=85310 RepID=A0A9P0H346_NEZVI|nr:unnamed protein product [Nezara viridula]
MFHRKVRNKQRPATSFMMGVREERFTISQLALRQDEKSNPKKKLINCLRKYCDATTLHGFKYLSEPNRPLYERIYWLVAIIIVYSTVAFIVIDQVEIYLRKPILITFDSKSRSVTEIPFPAVTICSDNQIHSSTINLTEAFDDFQHLSPEMRKRFEYAVYICNFNHPGEEFETFDPQFFHDMLENVFGIETCREQIPILRWSYTPMDTPCRYFQPIVTVQGACLSFNMVPFSYIFRNPTTIFRNWAEKYWTDKIKVWSPDTGYITGGGSYPDAPPWRTAGGNGVRFGFNIEMKDNEELCSRGGKGFSVYVHNPAEMPGPAHALLYLEENRETTVSVSPKFYITDESLKKWSTKERGCYFQNERFLKFFQIYTQHNCEMECKANFTLSICRCAPFYFPRNLNTSVCGSAKRQCMEKSIANVGGILGLFLGFSILSLVEIIYFIFFRPCTNSRQRKRIKPLSNNMRKLNYGSLVVSSKFNRGLSQYPSITLRNIRY